jgi:hypothetical protein
MIDIKGPDGTRTWDIIIRRGGETDRPVENMFNEHGQETFDVTEAYEYVYNGGDMRMVEAGDMFLFILVAD